MGCCRGDHLGQFPAGFALLRFMFGGTTTITGTSAGCWARSRQHSDLLNAALLGKRFLEPFATNEIRHDLGQNFAPIVVLEKIANR